MTKVVQFPATAPPRIPEDDAARSQALDTHASFIVEAPAGSGKTALLVQRFLKLLAEDTLGHAVSVPEEVLAMTFTRKATAELRERVLAELLAAQNNTPLRENASPFERQTREFAHGVLARSQHLGWDLLAQPQRLNIRGIDSVCMEIANATPLFSAGSTPLRPVEDPRPLYLQAARRTLLQLGSGNHALDNALRSVLLLRDGNFSDCESLIAEMLATREQWAELIPLAAEELTDTFLDTQVRPHLERSLEAVVCSGLARAVRALRPGLLVELTSIAARLSTHPPYKRDVSPISFCTGKQLPPQATAEHLDHWLALITLLLKKDNDWRKRCSRADLGFEIPKPGQAYLEQLVASIQSDALLEALQAIRLLPPAKYPDDQWAVAKSLFRILRHALAELKVLFAERSGCDFTELSLAAREVLAPGNSAADLYLAAGSRLRHLLLDEMQDTSTGQYDLIRLLTQSWDGHSQTLFLVGDPKQSIYLFRQARVERFLRTFAESRLGDLPLTPLRLTANFRSQQALVTGFNRTFDTIFPQPGAASLLGGDVVDVPFVEATPVRELTLPKPIHWHPAILNVDHRAQEALEIRRIVEQHLSAAHPPRIAILARTRGHLSAVVEEFKAHAGKPEIPFRAIDLDRLDERPEVQDALALTRALLHPADRIAWLAVLRAPWCGLSLVDLLALTGDDSAEPIASLIPARRTHLSTEGQQLLDRAWLVLALALSTLGVTSFSIHVERTWRSLGGDAPLTPEQLANVQTFFKLLQNLEAREGRIDLTQLTSQVEKLYAEPHHGDLHVDLLTMHSAKGLEWDIVLVPALERPPQHDSAVLLNWLELDASSPDEVASIILAPIWGKGQDSDKLNAWLRSLRTRRDRAEEKRLFYVACTRAREELHLFAALKQKIDGSLAEPPAATLLNACWPAAREEFSKLQAATPTIIPMPQPIASEPLALAAAAAPFPPPILQRLPLAFDPLARFNIPAADRLPYPAAATLPHAPAFDRPEGSFAVRAFGNVVHRFLQLIATRLETGLTPDALLTELPQWQPRIFTVLRAEGLAPNIARRDAVRALAALQQSLADPEGRWLLSPHANSTSEQPLTSSRLQDLRADRTFFAGSTPLTTGSSTFWIVDFKTTTARSLSSEDFEAAELAKYRAQLETYARIRRGLLPPSTPISLALYYPLLPRLIHWESRPEIASD